MLKSMIASLLLLTGFIACAGESTRVKEFQVEPSARYSLSFRVEVDAPKDTAWELQIFNTEGLLPFEGVYKRPWQKISPERKDYSHSFYTPRDGAKLVFLISSTGEIPEVTEFKLEKLTGLNLVVNGDFSAGVNNYSGWNAHRWSELMKDGKDNLVLKCQATGYALTDYIPVEPGATYRYSKGSSYGRVLVYDYDYMGVAQLPAYSHKKPLLEMPADAAYMRVEYCDGRTYRPGCPPVIRSLGIELVKRRAEPVKQTFPAYSGEIILNPGSPLAVIRGAREIQHWVRKISGKEMRVLARATKRKNLKLFVGKEWASRLFPEDLEFLKGSDGFAVRQKGNNIYIFSARPAGTNFGAIRFLEENTDMIFARPNNEFGTVYSKNPGLTFTRADFIKRPAFGLRMSQGVRANPYYTSIWHGRVGLNSPPYLYNQYRREEEGGIHLFDSNYMTVINQSPEYPAEVVKKKHLDLYALVDGKHITDHKFICPTHPEAAKALTAGFCAIMKKAEQRGIHLERIGVRVQDGWTVCSCKRCMQPITLPDGKLLKPKSESSIQDELFFSTRKAVLLNQVAKNFAKVYPGTDISCEAYIYESEPPAIPYHRSLIPTFCAYPTSSLRFPLLDKNNSPFWKRKFQGYLDWSREKNSRLSMFAYYYVAGFSALADTAAADWKAMTEAGGVHGVIMDGFPADNNPLTRFNSKTYGSWEYGAVEKWVMTRLLWDPRLDPQKLREYYINRAYRRASPQMLKFYTIVRKAWKDPAIKGSVNCHTPMGPLFDMLIVQPGYEKELRSLLVSAKSKAVHPNSKILINRTLIAFDKIVSSLNRNYIPNIVESTTEWNKEDSVFWIQAKKMGEFKRVSTWKDFKKAAPESQTKVSIMCDKDNLYFHFLALKAAGKDSVELILEASRHAPKYYFSLNRSGKQNTMKNFVHYSCPEWSGVVKDGEGSYTAMFKIPFAVIKELRVDGVEVKLFAKFVRLVTPADSKDRVESSLLGVSATRTHYMNYWTPLSVEKVVKGGK